MDARGRKGGLALLWTRSLDVEVKSLSSHHIEAIIKDGNSSGWRFLENFRQVVEECGLIDLGYFGFPFTWCNNFVSPYSTRARLDRALASKDWRDTFPNARLSLLSTNTSDHTPIYLNLGTKSNVVLKTRSRFRFEEGWCLYEESKGVVVDAWNKTQGMIRGIIISWKIKQEELDVIQQGVIELDVIQQGVITTTSKVNVILLAKDIDKLREADDMYWCQRSRAFSRVKGDRKTTYFQALAAQRGKSNLITALQDSDGFNREAEVHLEKEFTTEEVKQCLFSMAKTKAPGYDGMPAIFY
ncbi:hypothetical protein LIER_14350 [Lithospermum erythrorhizon]|uniref:Uncharacterized protein n=1 Tax=Lithospermum erythrorhizon TaxID=34254 RepID=A0AAV3Q0G6_LITER